MKAFRSVVVLVALVALARPASAQITLPYPLFTAGTVISPTQVNANNTQLSTYALNRSAGVMTGHLTFGTDNTHDIGASGATRPRDLFLGRNLTIGGTLSGVGGSFSGALGIGGNLTFSPDNTYDIGASGATRPRDLFLGRNATIGGTLGVTGNVAVNTSTFTVDTSTGRVGIGTASPANKFHVNSGAINYDPSLADSQPAAATYVSAGVELSQGVYTSSPYAWWTQVKSGSAGWAYLLNPLGGNVGIGVTNPSARLTLPSGTAAADGILFGSDTNLYRSAANQLKTDDSLVVAGALSGATGAFSSSVSSDYPATISNTGTGSTDHGLNVLTASNNANTRILHVGKTITGGGASSFVVYGDGAIRFPELGTTASAANAFLDSTSDNKLLRSTSSIRYKTDVRDLGRGLEVVLGLRPVTYLAKDKPDGPRYPGFIAEEVAPLEPILATYDPDGTPNYVQYDRVTAYLVNAVKELAARVAALEAELARERQR